MRKTKTKLWEWQQKANDGGICVKCGCKVSKLSVDHIIPVTIVEVLDNTGLAVYDDEDNFQLMCYPCNKMKQNRLDKTNPKTIPLLKKYNETPTN